MISLELRRALYKAFGLRPDGLQRLIIDIKPDSPPIIYAQMASTGSTVEEVIETVYFSDFEVKRVEILEASTEEFTTELTSTTADTGETVFGSPNYFAPEGCTNDAHCKVKELHIHKPV